jgi:acyl-CoA thioester hydrolase
MAVPRILVSSFVIPDSVIDVNGHVNNLAYLQWMQEAAIEHSARQGWPLERYQQGGTAWVVRSHFIEYLLPAFAGESLALLTWVSGFRGSSSPRQFMFWRSRDQQVVARAETLWVFVETGRGRPAPIPPELSAAFEIVPPSEDVLALVRQAPGSPDAAGAVL